MADEPRYIPPDSLVEITVVVLQNRYLLRPSTELNDIVLGVLGQAQQMYDMRVCGATVASTHYHLLLVPRDITCSFRTRRRLRWAGCSTC